MQDRFKFRYVFKKDFGGKTGICYKMPIFNLDTITDENFNKIVKSYIDYDYKLISIEQCTGLKDKNGKLIYEGDILKYTSKPTNTQKNNPEYKPFTENYSVVWEDFYTGYNLRNKEKVNCFNLGIMTKDCEIIGNIYENPELLEGGCNGEN